MTHTMKVIDINSYPDAEQVSVEIASELKEIEMSGMSYVLKIDKNDYNGYAVIIDLFRNNIKIDRVYVTTLKYDQSFLDSLKKQTRIISKEAAAKLF